MISGVVHHTRTCFISPRKNFSVKDKGIKEIKDDKIGVQSVIKQQISNFKLITFLLYFDFFIIIDLFYYCRGFSTMQQSPEATVPTIMSKWSCYWSAAQRTTLTQLRLIIQVKHTQVGALRKCKKSIKGLRKFQKKAMSVANTSNWFSKFYSSSMVLGTTPKRTEK